MVASTELIKTNSGIFDFDYRYPLTTYSFVLPGTGNAGLHCGANRLSAFSIKGDAVKYSPLHCRRIECPTCYSDWVRRATFHLAMVIEAYARANSTRPYRCVFSVSPEHVEKSEWDWEKVNTSLFHRGYRRAAKVGVDGGIALFHPFRIKKYWKKELRRQGEHTEIGMWQAIRARINKGEPLHQFVSLGPHVHSVLFGNPERHSCDDFVIAFQTKDDTLTELKELSDVVGFTRYLLSHVGVLDHLSIHNKYVRDTRNGKIIIRDGAPVVYKRAIRRKMSHTIRAYGVLFRLDPKRILAPAKYQEAVDFVREQHGDDLNEKEFDYFAQQKFSSMKVDAYDKLAGEVAVALGMLWNAESGTLHYPAYVGNLAQCEESDDGVEWVSIFKLNRYLSNSTWLGSLSHSQCKFFLVLGKSIHLGRPPDLKDLKPPSDVKVFIEREPAEAKQ